MEKVYEALENKIREYYNIITVDTLKQISETYNVPYLKLIYIWNKLNEEYKIEKSDRVNKNLRFKIKINVFSVEAHKWECWASDARQNDG
jgi:hypothetical protein